jgi:hypothetical protein
VNEKRLEYRALDTKVLAVAVEGAVGDWACYIGAVKGWNHHKEMKDVAAHGNKQSEELARLMFSREPWKSLRYRH